MTNIGLPEVTSGEFPVLPDGMYTVNGFGRLISTDDNGEPNFRPPKNSDVLKLSFEFRTANGGQGPACSLTATEFYALANYFNADALSGITFQNRMHIQTVKDAIEKANVTGKTLNVKSEDGWVNRVKEAHLPPSIYTLKFKEARAADPDLTTFLSGDFGHFMIFVYEIIGDMYGKQTMWSGAEWVDFMNNPFAGADENGVVQAAYETGRPAFAQVDGRNVPAAVKWVDFATIFAPKLFEHEWITDPLKSEYGIDELRYPQIVWVKEAQKAGIVKVAPFALIKTRYGFSLRQIKEMSTSAPQVKRENVKDQFKTWIMGRYPDVNIFSDGLAMTDAGRDWAKTNLETPWKSANLGSKRRLDSLTDDEVKHLFDAFKALNEPTAESETW